MKRWKEQERILISANRMPVMSAQQIQEKKMLEDLRLQKKEQKKQSKEGAASSGDDNDDKHTSDTNKGRNNLKKGIDMMITKMTEMSDLMKQDADASEHPLELEQVKQLLTSLDDDTRTGGLKLEAEERSEIRMMFLRQYAKHSMAKIQRKEQL
jgi:hypothetical protein